MRSLINFLSGLITLVLLAVVGLVVYVGLVLDPNDYRDDIEQLAQQQGIPLQLKGDVAWQWYPNLGLRLQEVSLETGSQTLLDASAMSASLAVAPLLQGEVAIQAIELHGVAIRLLVNEQGQGNWEVLTQGPPSGSKEAQPASAIEQQAKLGNSRKDLAVAIEQLTIIDATLNYHDRQQDTQVSIEGLNLSAQNINAQGQPFSWQNDFRLLLDGQPSLSIDTDGTVALDLKQQIFSLSPLSVKVSAGDNPLAMTLDGQVNLATMEPDVKLQLASVNLKRWLKSMQVDLPPMDASDALQKLQLSTHLQGKDGGWQLNDLDMVFDESHFKGHAEYTAKQVIKLVLSGDRLDVDRYMAPSQESKEPANNAKPNDGVKSTTAAKAAALPKTPLPFEPLKSVQANIQLALDRFKVSDLQMQQVKLKANANKGLINLTQLDAQFYEGSIGMTAQLNARQPQAVLSAKGQLTQVALKPLLTDLSEEQRASGKADINFDASTKGKSLFTWQQRLSANSQLQISSLTIEELDVERDFCELAALVNKQEKPNAEWKGLTNMQDVAVKLKVTGSQVQVQQLQAGVEDLRLKATGAGDYDKGSFDLRADVAVIGAATAERACQINDRWRNVDLPLRCKGDVESLSAGTCKPDKDRLDDLLRDQLKGEAKSKLEEKIEEKLGPGAKELLQGIFGR